VVVVATVRSNGGTVSSVVPALTVGRKTVGPLAAAKEEALLTKKGGPGAAEAQQAGQGVLHVSGQMLEGVQGGASAQAHAPERFRMSLDWGVVTRTSPTVADLSLLLVEPSQQPEKNALPRIGLAAVEAMLRRHVLEAFPGNRKEEKVSKLKLILLIYWNVVSFTTVK
jgi:hypothetical protein